MNGLEVFDKDGNPLKIGDVIEQVFTELEARYPKYDRITLQSLDGVYAVGHTEIAYEPDSEDHLLNINNL